MKISVLIPTLLREDPRRYREGRLWVEAAIESVRDQTILRNKIADIEIVVAVDNAAGEILPERHSAIESVGPITWTRGVRPGNAYTVNAAAGVARGEIFALLDDDDLWHPEWLSVATPLLGAYDFISANPQLIDLAGKSLGPFDCASPSSWIISRAQWEKLGGLSASSPLHPDTEFLGRLNAAGARRVHLLDAASRSRKSEWLDRIVNHSEILITRDPPLVFCSRARGHMTDRIKSTPELLAKSRAEYDAMIARFGAVPW